MLEIAVGNWPFSDQFSPFGQTDSVKFTVHSNGEAIDS